ncbi:MAG: HD domain-containing protein [Alphaproteobacteria bacterium]|nr:MAG: HD domain-containing protein [Alphaproteobacteria bacterium]
MHRISIIGDSRARVDDLHRQFPSVADVEFRSLEQLSDAEPGHYTLFDIDLDDVSQLVALRDWLRRRPAHAKVIFATDKASRLQNTRAYALGATDVIHRPLAGKTLLTKFWGDVSTLAHESPAAETQAAPGVAAAVDVLKNIFSAACLGAPIESGVMQAASGAVVSQLEEQGLSAWVETVRMHHSQTYQHCLLVTGVAAAFGQQIGLSEADRRRLSHAGMLHDVGKARIPLAILEKSGPLDADEWAVMRKHPEYGRDALDTASDLPAGMLDIVVHHHEYLDGSGYPHRLQGKEISDFVRIMTIADVFGALIERRSYKPPLSVDAAYQILLDMGPKLDRDLVRAFKPVSHLAQLH